MSQDEPASKRSKISVNEDEPDMIQMKKHLTAIDLVQNEIDDLNEKASDEILKVEQKYNAERRPMYERRGDIIKNIPDFWSSAILNHPQLGTIVDEEEELLLKALQHIEVEEFDDIKSGYKIKFVFLPNDYFENDVIVKEYNLNSDNPGIRTTEIRWKEGQSLIQKLVERRGAPIEGEENLSAGQTFTEWLSSGGDPASDDIAELIKDDLWQNPLQYYLMPDLGSEDGEDDPDRDETIDELDGASDADEEQQ